MGSVAVTTIMRPRDEVERLWQDSPGRHAEIDAADGAVTFQAAPGDRGTEVRVQLARTAPGGTLGEAAAKLTGRDPLGLAKDELRRFKQLAETGVITQSDAFPAGESLRDKPKGRPAQPLDATELERANA